MKGLALIICLIMTIGCAHYGHYSTAGRLEEENIINAPIDVVWEKTLQILPTERMTLREIDKDNYFVEAKKHITFWSFGDNISIRLISKRENQTVMNFDAGMCFLGGDFGHEGRMVRNIFNRIKNASEGTLPHKEP